MGLKTYNPSILPERIIEPLESMGLVEQEKRPEKEGSRKKIVFVRIKKYPDLLLLMNLKDLYQEGERAYNIFDQLCKSHEEHVGTSMSYSPAEKELFEIAERIEQYCKTPAMAFVVACVARPDLYEEHKLWDRAYSPIRRLK